MIDHKEQKPKPSFVPHEEKKGVEEKSDRSHLARENINSKPSLFLPEDIIAEILLRLPRKSLLKFRCVSTSWHSLIGSNRFIKTYYYRYLGSDLAFSKGIFCILNQWGLSLWNPDTTITIHLPKLENVIDKYGFGWDKQSGAYKVFAVVCDGNRRIGKVYSLKTRSWKTVENECVLSYNDRVGVFAGGKIYWMNGSEDGIESFDLETEEFGRIHLPRELVRKNQNMWLSVTSETLTLCVSRGTCIDVFVMKEGFWASGENIPLSNDESSTSEESNELYKAFFCSKRFSHQLLP